MDQAIQAAYQYYPNGSPTPTITPTPVNFPTLSPDTLKIVTITPTPTADFNGNGYTDNNTESIVIPNGYSIPNRTATPGPTSTVTPTPSPFPTSTPYTLQGFQDAYKNGLTQLTSIGLTEAQVRQLYESNILRQKLLDVITGERTKNPGSGLGTAHSCFGQATANAVRQRLLNGEDFAKVAAEVSIDTGTKDKGGDLGWFGKGAMVAEFEAAAFSQKVGEIGQPVKSQFGYHIIQVLAHEEVPLDASSYQQAKQTAFNAWLTKRSN